MHIQSAARVVIHTSVCYLIAWSKVWHCGPCTFDLCTVCINTSGPIRPRGTTSAPSNPDSALLASLPPAGVNTVQDLSQAVEALAASVRASQRLLQDLEKLRDKAEALAQPDIVSLVGTAEARLDALAGNDPKAVCAGLSAHRLWLTEVASRLAQQQALLTEARRAAAASPMSSPVLVSNEPLAPLTQAIPFARELARALHHLRDAGAAIDRQNALLRPELDDRNAQASARIQSLAETHARTNWAALSATVRAQIALTERAAEEVEQGTKFSVELEAARASLAQLRKEARRAKCDLDDAIDDNAAAPKVADLRAVYARKQAALEAAERALQGRPAVSPLAARLVPKWAAPALSESVVGDASQPPPPSVSSSARELGTSAGGGVLPPSCVVCMCDFDEGARKAKLLHCGHTFCAACLAGVAGKANSLSCPTCRGVTPLLVCPCALCMWCGVSVCPCPCLCVFLSVSVCVSMWPVRGFSI